MIVMNILIWRKIQEFARIRRTALGINDGTLKEARILISIVAIFIFCQSFTIVADAYEAFTCSFENMSQSRCPSNPTIENIIDCCVLERNH